MLLLYLQESAMSTVNLPDFIQFFQEPGHYDHPVDQVSLVQTHISYVLLAGDFVYKFKKPVDFGFLDFTTLAKRKHFCEQELLLNRRLCPDIYLDTFAVHGQDKEFSFSDNGGEIVEYGLKMRRMPQERMMAEVIAAGGVTEQTMAGIVDILVPFYARAASTSEIQQFGLATSVAVNVLENFEQTEGFIGQGALSQEQFAAISSYARDFLTNEELFRSRLDHVKDCHGDLYSANICLTEPVAIFDCIEFNERFRYCDVASDVAFLAMDLDFQGLDTLANSFIDRFVAASGDTTLKDVLNFYKCYRAYVRGKIGLFTAASPEVDEAVKASSLEMAARYFRLAHDYARA